MYWDNIDARVVETQRRVFAHFGLSIAQLERTGLAHGDFLDGFMAEIGEEDFALSRRHRLFSAEPRDRRQGVRGRPRGRHFRLRAVEHPHRPGPPVHRADVHGDLASHLGPARPAELSPRREQRRRATPVRRRRRSRDRDGDALPVGIDRAEMAARRRRALRAWRVLSRRRVHLFEARKTPFMFILFEVAEAVVNDRPIDYPSLMQEALERHGNQRWARRFTRWRKAIWLRRALKRLRGAGAADASSGRDEKRG